VAGLSTWQVYEPGRRDVLEAIDLSARWQISFWDAMLLVACQKAGVMTVWSEDLKHRQTYDGVTVLNPFLPHSDS